jgi:Ala-tRNA(Pro) deacylase
VSVSEPSSVRGVAAVLAYLEASGVPYELLEHPPAGSMRDEAASVGADARHAAKTLALHDHGRWALAVIPATHRLDLDRARRLLRATRHLRLATEQEMADAFPDFEVGALPPLGPQLPRPEVIDIRLLYRDHIVCAGGDHGHALRLDPRDVIRLAEPRVGDVCEHDVIEHRKGFVDLPAS